MSEIALHATKNKISMSILCYIANNYIKRGDLIK
uniref:Uncharacterized protein n=1 Tax=Anguilla anguilla TaxID=7936 RepID=A0A0E9RZL8_ANGAN